MDDPPKKARTPNCVQFVTLELLSSRDECWKPFVSTQPEWDRHEQTGRRVCVQRRPRAAQLVTAGRQTSRRFG